MASDAISYSEWQKYLKALTWVTCLFRAVNESEKLNVKEVKEEGKQEKEDEE